MRTMRRKLLVLLALSSVPFGGAALGDGAAASVGECPPVVGCQDIPGICIKPDDPTNTRCEPATPAERERGNLICVGGDNQRKPGSYQGVCIGNPFFVSHD